MQPAYFLKDLTPEQLVIDGALDQTTLHRFHLADTFRDAMQIKRDCQVAECVAQGPEGSSGTLLAYHTADGRRIRDLAFYESWEWSEMTPGLWMGTNPADPTTELDLRRRKMIKGSALPIDDQGWIVPKCRQPNGSTDLPASIVLGENSTLSLPVKTEFVKAYNACGEVMQWFFDESYRELATDREMVELAVWLIGLNYRFGWWEQNRFKLLDTTNLMTVLAWSISLFDEVKV